MVRKPERLAALVNNKQRLATVVGDPRVFVDPLDQEHVLVLGALQDVG